MRRGIFAAPRPWNRSPRRKRELKLTTQLRNNWKQFRNRDGAGRAKERRFPNRRGDSEIALPCLALVDLAGVVFFRGRAALYFSLRSTHFSARKHGAGELGHVGAHDQSGSLGSTRLPPRS